MLRHPAVHAFWSTVAIAVVVTAGTGLGASSATAAPISPDFGSGNPGWDNYYNAPSNSSTWTAFCAGGGGTVVTDADGLPACGPTGGDSIEVPGGISTPGFQCVELSERELYISHGWTAIVANGAQVAERYAAAHNVRLVKNGTANAAPQVGDVMSFSTESSYGDTGHTGVVTSSSVNSSGNGTISLLSENVSDTGNLSSFSVHNWTVEEIFGYPYSEWIQSGVPATTSNGSFVQVSGSAPVYQIVGGAPLYVSSWTNVGGKKPLNKISAAQFATLRQYPANGTAVYDDAPGADHGAGFEFAGGAPLPVAKWTNIGSPSITGVDPYSLLHYAATGPLSHVRQYPLNGTAVFVDNPGAGHGAGYEFAGGAPLPVAKWTNIGSPQITGVDSFALTHFPGSAIGHVRQYPLNGTAVYNDDPGSDHGAGFVFAGGAPLPVAGWTNIGSPPITGVDDYALTHPSPPGPTGDVLAHPADNTYLRGGQTGEVFRVLHGIASYLPSWTSVGGPKPTVTVDQIAIDKAGTGGSWNALISGTPHLHLTGPPRHTRRGKVTAHWTAPPQSAEITGFDVRETHWRGHHHHRWTRPRSLQNTTTTTTTSHRLPAHQHWCLSVRAHNLAGLTGSWTTHCTIRR